MLVVWVLFIEPHHLTSASSGNLDVTTYSCHVLFSSIHRYSTSKSYIPITTTLKYHLPFHQASSPAQPSPIPKTDPSPIPTHHPGPSVPPLPPCLPPLAPKVAPSTSTTAPPTRPTRSPTHALGHPSQQRRRRVPDAAGADCERRRAAGQSLACFPAKKI